MNKHVMVFTIVIVLVGSISITSASAQVLTTQVGANKLIAFVQDYQSSHSTQYGQNGLGRLPATSTSSFDLTGYKKVCAYAIGNGAGNQVSITMGDFKDGLVATVATGKFDTITCVDVEAPQMDLILIGHPGRTDYVSWWIYMIS